MRYGLDHKAATHQAVLQEAAKVIWREGPDRLTVGRVMAAAGLTHGGFYGHFRSREDLVAQVVGAMFDELRGRMLVVLNAAPAGAETQALVRSYLSARHRDHPHYGCPVAALAGIVAGQPDAVQTRFAAGVAAIATILAARLTELGGAPAAQDAMRLFSDMSGALALARGLGPGPASDALLIGKRGEILARLARSAAHREADPAWPIVDDPWPPEA